MNMDLLVIVLQLCYYTHNKSHFFKDPTSHLMKLEPMFKTLEHARLKLELSKNELFNKQITYLGHIVSAQMIATDGKMTEVIEKWPTHTTITEV